MAADDALGLQHLVDVLDRAVEEHVVEALEVAPLGGVLADHVVGVDLAVVLAHVAEEVHAVVLRLVRQLTDDPHRLLGASGRDGPGGRQLAAQVLVHGGVEELQVQRRVLRLEGVVGLDRQGPVAVGDVPAAGAGPHEHPAAAHPALVALAAVGGNELDEHVRDVVGDPAGGEVGPEVVRGAEGVGAQAEAGAGGPGVERDRHRHHRLVAAGASLDGQRGRREVGVPAQQRAAQGEHATRHAQSVVAHLAGRRQRGADEHREDALAVDERRHRAVLGDDGLEPRHVGLLVLPEGVAVAHAARGVVGAGHAAVGAPGDHPAERAHVAAGARDVDEQPQPDALRRRVVAGVDGRVGWRDGRRDLGGRLGGQPREVDVGAVGRLGRRAAHHGDVAARDPHRVGEGVHGIHAVGAAQGELDGERRPVPARR